MKHDKSPLTKPMNPIKRRRFMKLLGMAMAAPAIPAALRFAANEMAMGTAYAEEMAQKVPTYFIEINYRDQWDFGHVFVAPGLATANGLIRGEDGRKCAMYYGMDQLTREANNIFLTPESLALRPHLDSIAMIETCELSVGEIHGHEAANALRSPGRGYNSGPGRGAMWEKEPERDHKQGNEHHYSSTPTPAVLHNYAQKQAFNGIRNGLTFKGISRAHTCYHFDAGLPGADLDRFQSVNALLNAFPDNVEDYNILPTAQEAETLQRLMNRLDARFLKKYNYTQQVVANHNTQLTDAQRLIYVGEPKIFKLPLTQPEIDFWKAGVPDQRGHGPGMKANIWEQVAYAHKLIKADMVRSISLEFDYVDVHDRRTRDQMDVMTKQTVLPLVRLIQKLKEDGLYDRTLIAAYSLDGGRSPAANSAGNEGKNTVLLAGGMIKGGYYGDVRVAGRDGDGHTFSFHAPDVNTGQPRNDGAVNRERDKRIAAKHVWRTIMKAVDVPDSLATQFADTKDAKVLNWLIKT